MTIKRFEEIEAWQRARLLTQTVYRLTDRPTFRDLPLASQLQRAAVSSMSNIAEGFDSGQKMEFVRFLGYARRSASEVQCHLYVAHDRKYIDKEQFDMAYGQAEVVRKLVAAFQSYLRRSTRQPANRPTG